MFVFIAIIIFCWFFFYLLAISGSWEFHLIRGSVILVYWKIMSKIVRLWKQGLISSALYEQLLCAQIPKAQNLTALFELLGSANVKATHRTLIQYHIKQEQHNQNEQLWLFNFSMIFCFARFIKIHYANSLSIDSEF